MWNVRWKRTTMKSYDIVSWWQLAIACRIFRTATNITLPHSTLLCGTPLLWPMRRWVWNLGARSEMSRCGLVTVAVVSIEFHSLCHSLDQKPLHWTIKHRWLAHPQCGKHSMYHWRPKQIIKVDAKIRAPNTGFQNLGWYLRLSHMASWKIQHLVRGISQLCNQKPPCVEDVPFLKPPFRIIKIVEFLIQTSIIIHFYSWFSIPSLHIWWFHRSLEPPLVTGEKIPGFDIAPSCDSSRSGSPATPPGRWCQ